MSVIGIHPGGELLQHRAEIQPRRQSQNQVWRPIVSLLGQAPMSLGLSEMGFPCSWMCVLNEFGCQAFWRTQGHDNDRHLTVWLSA